MKKTRLIIALALLFGMATLAEAQIVVSSTSASTTRIHDKSGREKGLVIRPEIAFTHDVYNPEGNLLNIHATAAYQFDPYFSIGGGLGVDNLHCSSNHYDDFTLTGIPVYLNGRAYFLDRKVSPYLDLKVGYHIPLNECSNQNSYDIEYEVFKMKGLLFNGTLGAEYCHFDLGFTVSYYNVYANSYSLFENGQRNYVHLAFLATLAYNLQIKK